ncbi:MAG TPA: FkbM family methyltransferase [Terracidiphilus sp.]|nr:FkbM family methyltransferase [Terracidiphilus sp.]
MSISNAEGKASPISLLGRLLRLPLWLVPRSAVVPVLTGVNRGRRWIAGASSTNSSWIGTYEQDHARALVRLVKPGSMVYDVGANVGFYSLALSNLVGTRGHVFCFEPEARNMTMLRRHIVLNHVDNVTLVQAAVSDGTALVGFEGGREQGHIGASSSYLIPSLSLDEFIAHGNPVPEFVKMDIEGAERWGLAGAKSLLEQRKTVWMVATHSEELRVHCAQIFANLGYRLAGFDGASDPSNAADFLAFP